MPGVDYLIKKRMNAKKANKAAVPRKKIMLLEKMHFMRIDVSKIT